MQLKQVCQFLDEFAPTDLAEDWDNVGLLVGDPEMDVNRIMTCLTITPESANEAIAGNAQLVVSHHPLPFRPINKITTEQTSTKLLWQLIQNGIAIYSPHTGFDSASNGINQSVCNQIGLENVSPLLPDEKRTDGLGSGRFGRLPNPMPLDEFLKKMKDIYDIENLRYVADSDATIQTVASACGSGGSFLSTAVDAGCDALITGEADFHSCLEASARNLALILVGHFSSERFAIEMLAEKLRESFNQLEVWASEKESDPVRLA